MTDPQKLRLIKIIHTLVWLFFNVVIFYMLYAVVVNKIDHWLWWGYAFILLEGLTLWAFRFYCPLTVLARRYSDSPHHNFDIYLPEWLARHNKTIYIAIMVVIFCMTIYRLI